ncbi:phage integrase SAM-like domain-containing protein [uncultured Parabacteroides sp.]|uniref:phage integrase SAM-like domain-containing protein n=1 Tax=uncultured Parabacteroides sp. TaxID=512312 RepID=UPI00261263B4|nr:phage integrase SAM-like domain-containing protein [uncultured Parabacteroides sp.]
MFVVLKSSTVEKYLLFHIDKLKTSNRHGTASTFEDLHICLKKFDKSFSKRLFPDINFDYVSRFFENERNAGREVGGIGVNLRALRTLLNSAIKENVGSPKTYPFSNQYGTRIEKDTFGLAKEVKTNTRKHVSHRTE